MLLREAIKTFDLERWLASRGAEPGDREWLLDCPICGKRKLCVNTQKRMWHCWVCQRYVVDPDGKRRAARGAGGLLKLIQLVDGVDRSRAIDQVLSGAMFAYRDISLIPPDELRSDILASLSPALPIRFPDGWQPITQPLPYMEQRQITMEDVRFFGLGWCNSGPYQGRLIFPVWDGPNLVYYQGRAMWANPKLKALNPPAIPGAAVSSELLMNLDLAARYPRVAIVEGPTDLVRTGPDAVATFGKRITAAQIARLMRAGVQRIDLMWDSDAKAEMLEVSTILSALFDTRLVFLPHGDPGDWSRQDLCRFRHDAGYGGVVSRLRYV